MTVAEILGRFPALSALVAGDICLDRWCGYDPAAADPSRETGIPRIGVVATEVTPGAGGTVANNLAALGAGRVAVLGAIGDDGFGFELRRALGERGIGSELLLVVPGMQTFTYTKIINRETGLEDRPRLDFINTRPLDPAAEAILIERFRAAAPAADVVLVSDQAETEQGGVVTAALREEISAFARSHPEKIVWIDSRLRPELFRGGILKPNQQEAEAASRRVLGEVNYRLLRERVQARLLMVTHGAAGVALIDDEGERWVPARPVANPVDICGAGDSFSAGAALALAAGSDPEEAARFGNLVASITIMKRGTGTASPAELLEAAAR